jgi:hypothetical protein
MTTGSLGDLELFIIINSTLSTKVTLRMANAVEMARRGGNTAVISSFWRQGHERKGCGAQHQPVQELFRAALRFARVPRKNGGRSTKTCELVGPQVRLLGRLRLDPREAL